jgi:hypothetical protein
LKTTPQKHKRKQKKKRKRKQKSKKRTKTENNIINTETQKTKQTPRGEG